MLFADDLVKLFMFKNTCTKATIKREINKELELLNQWANQWRLTFAPHKCGYIIFKNLNLNDKKDKDGNIK